MVEVTAPVLSLITWLPSAVRIFFSIREDISKKKIALQPLSSLRAGVCRCQGPKAEIRVCADLFSWLGSQLAPNVVGI